MRTLARPDDLADIVRRVRTVRPSSAARWGRMSAHQMVCHLGDSLCVAMGQKTVSTGSGLLQQTLVKWIALYLPLRWPPGIPTRPELDQEIGGTKPQEFATDIGRVESLLRRLAEEPASACPPHPIFGPMSREAWLRWAFVHTDHHLRQFSA